MGNEKDLKNQLVELIQEGIDWEYLLNLAEYHGMIPLLYLGLRDLGQEIVPKRTINSLKTFYFDNTQRNISLLGQMRELVKALNTANISAIPFKGPILSKYLFDNYSIRHAGDLDLLIKPKDVARVVEFLDNQGFKLYYPLSKNQQIALATISRDNRLMLIHHKNKLIIEIHWRFYSSDLAGKKATTLAWTHTETAIINDVVLNILRPEVTLLFMCFHLYKHNWDRLFWIWELNKFLQSEIQLDWKWIIKHSVFFGGINVLLLSLYVVNQLLNTSLPNELEKLISENYQIKNLYEQIKFAPERNTINVNHNFNTLSLMNRFNIKQNRTDKLKQFLQFAFTPNFFDIRSVDLPPKLHFLYFVIRPFGLFLRSLRSLFTKTG